MDYNLNSNYHHRKGLLITQRRDISYCLSLLSILPSVSALPFNITNLIFSDPSSFVSRNAFILHCSTVSNPPCLNCESRPQNSSIFWFILSSRWRDNPTQTFVSLSQFQPSTLVDSTTLPMFLFC